MELCIDCKEFPRKDGQYYCQECCEILAEDRMWSDSLSDNDLDYSSTKGSVNLEDKVNRVHPQLGCTYCKPHMGENTSNSWKFNGRRSDKKKIALARRQGSEFKKNQYKTEDE